MPCHSRQYSTIDFGEATDVSLLAKAFTALGYTVKQTGKALVLDNTTTGTTGTFENGKLGLTTGQWASLPVDLNEIKRAYSAEVIKSAATRFGWKVKSPEANKFQVTRSY